MRSDGCESSTANSHWLNWLRGSRGNLARSENVSEITKGVSGFRAPCMSVRQLSLGNKKQCRDTVVASSPYHLGWRTKLGNMTPQWRMKNPPSPCGEWKTWPLLPWKLSNICRPTCCVKPLKCDSLTGPRKTTEGPPGFRTRTRTLYVRQRLWDPPNAGRTSGRFSNPFLPLVKSLVREICATLFSSNTAISFHTVLQ